MPVAEDRGVVVFNPEASVARFAGELCSYSGKDAFPWPPGQLPPALPPTGPAVLLLLGLEPDAFDRYEIMRAALEFSGERRRPIGVVTGADLADIAANVARFRSPPPPAPGPGWILAPGQILHQLAPNPGQFDGANLSADLINALAVRNAKYGIVAGHGREDILYLGAAAFCGQRSVAHAPRPCEKDCCSYPHKKFHIDSLRAAALFLLSCNAGRIGPGLMPESCRLALSAYGRSAHCVVAPNRLITASPRVVETVRTHLEAGTSVGEAALAAGRLQTRLFSERDPFIVFGDPDYHPITATACIAEARSPERAQPAAAVDRVRRLTRVIDHHIHSGLLKDRIGPMRAVIETIEATLLKRNGMAGVTHLATLEAAWDTVKTLAAHDLFDASMSNFFWLSNAYSLYPQSELSDTCPLCTNRAYRYRLVHPVRPAVRRDRLICVRCGIVADQPSGRNRFTFTKVGLRHHGENSMIHAQLAVRTAASDGVLAVALNNGAAQLIESVVMAKERRASFALPAKVASGHLLKVQLTCTELRPGIYFAKAFFVCDDGVFETSAPIHVTAQPGNLL